jgi:hypothetical protein
LTAQLLPDFQTQIRRFRARFDTSEVSAFQEDAHENAKRVTLLYEAGILRGDRAQALLGLEVDPSRAKYADEIEQEDALEVVEATPEPAPTEPSEAAAEPDAPDGEDETTKLLRGIRHRLGVTNGNGHH